MIAADRDVLDSPVKLPFLWLEITEKCNLECAHCYADSSPARPLKGVLRLNDWTAVLDEAADLGCERVQFIGGEPTLHPDLFPLVEIAATRHFSFIEIFTNLTTATDAFLELCSTYGISLATSFYSADAAAHDRITRRPGSFERTVNGLRRAVASGLRVRAGVVDIAGDAETVSAAIALLGDLGVTDYRIDRARGVGRGAALMQVRDPWRELCGRCSDGSLCIAATGMVFPCVMSRCAPLGNARLGLERILSGLPLAQFASELKRHHAFATADSCDPKVCEPTCSPPIMCVPLSECNPTQPFHPHP